MSEEELQDQDTWDLEAAERRPGVARSRAVVSVAFHREEFERVAEAALKRAAPERELMELFRHSGTSGCQVFTERPLPSTEGPVAATVFESALTG